jgi:hypothetical protein
VVIVSAVAVSPVTVATTVMVSPVFTGAAFLVVFVIA